MAVQAVSSHAKLALRAIQIASERELEAFRDVCAPDVVLSFPFHPNGAETHHGVEEMIKQFSVEKAFQTFSLEAVNLYDNGEVIIVEGRSHGTYKSGRPDYRNHYIFVITCSNGRITHWNEFFNPLEAMKQNYGKPKPEKAMRDA